MEAYTPCSQTKTQAIRGKYTFFRRKSTRWVAATQFHLSVMCLIPSGDQFLTKVTLNVTDYRCAYLMAFHFLRFGTLLLSLVKQIAKRIVHIQISTCNFLCFAGETALPEWDANLFPHTLEEIAAMLCVFM